MSLTNSPRPRQRTVFASHVAVLLVIATFASSAPAADLLATGHLSSRATTSTLPAWDIHSDTWVATDGLGRAVAGFDRAGPPKPARAVGIFYFLWLGQHTTSGPHDISRILAANPDDPPWGPPSAFHHWSEPLFGYYVSNDEYVIRKHAQMLADAGVDTLVFDATNAFAYLDNVLTLARVFRELRALGNPTPSFCFLAHKAAAEEAWEKLYSQGLYSELWFRWEGKPLLLTNSDPAELPGHFASFFTIRRSWAWNAAPWFGDGRDRWPWLDHHPQKWGWHESSGVPEEIAVCVAQHPTTNIGRSFHNGRQPPPAERRPEAGLCFLEQWSRALDVNPPFVFVTGWNEWVAQRFINNDPNFQFVGRPLPAGGSYFVDAYSQEFSRDIEPMKGRHEDAYYYQMVDQIRLYKGVRPPPEAGPSKTIGIDGDFADWTDVTPEFRDTLGDPARRDHPGWGDAGRYTDATGRNDLAVLKVARDATHLFFHARARQPLSPPSDSNWMLLLLDIDRDTRTGWLGYDYVINRVIPSATGTTLERWDAGNNSWTHVQELDLRVSGPDLELAIPRRALPDLAAPLAFEFKWADNIEGFTGAAEFTLHGDAAPNDRFNYLFIEEAPSSSVDHR